MMKRLLTLLLTLMLLLPVAAHGESPFVRFYLSTVVGHVGREVTVLADCVSPSRITRDNNEFELRDAQGRVYCTKTWSNPSSRLSFRFTAEEWMLGGQALSVWRSGEKVSSEDCHLAISDLSVLRVTQLEPSEPAISLTIVCGGGSTRNMDDILAVLEKYGVKATFFINGGYLTAKPEDARRIIENGHELGSHGNQHLHMTELDDLGQMRKNITIMNRRCEEELGVRPRLFRAPYSETNQKVTALCRAEGMEDIMWNIDSKDWSDDYKGRPERIVKRVTGSNVVSGSVIQFHLNGHHTAEVLDEVIPIYLNEYGYRIVTVSELMELSGRELPPLPEGGE